MFLFVEPRYGKEDSEIYKTNARKYEGALLSLLGIIGTGKRTRGPAP